jgi:hypothetical protein
MVWTNHGETEEGYTVQLWAMPDTRPAPKIPKGKHIIPIERAKPKSFYCHYSNPDCQGSLIAETGRFPDYYDETKMEYHSAYSDRLASWDYDHYRKLCDKYGGDQMWHNKLAMIGTKKLKEFAKMALKLEDTPAHVRVVYYFNVSNGYGCPVIIALTKKAEEKDEEND